MPIVCRTTGPGTAQLTAAAINQHNDKLK